DYNFWLGPAPERPYNVRHGHYNFRFFWDYSGGQLTNWGARHLDIAQGGLGMDESGPVSIEGRAKYNQEKLYDVPQWREIIYEYANRVQIIVRHDQRGGTPFEGDKGTIHDDPRRLESTPPELVEQPVLSYSAQLAVNDMSHHANW